ncbi:type II toxin-antitoxin system RelE/ParE family toxin [Dehalobacterium formicoaceticum]|uniref:Type II toxin-antitoxin system RelE/ParE family toxin n=1 Tax=Dehalobacterium formicoaceticum TaxID=51515 RepID=A0ABT1Y7Y7_9FIRM|nr:type II toxin-antitoxin system RelE/ParE family toxin [Dehalobacterium formicoaceticum]MCR6546987.1 type II toxin-antitoxin system RelE/ParE family toxin [Dehalobacterium formicoaceticum]
MLPVIYTPVAEKYFKKLKDNGLKRAFQEAITSIRKNPYVGQAKTGDLNGLFSMDIYYNRTNYELAYRVSALENGDIVVIIMAGTREIFYKELKRYLNF